VSVLPAHGHDPVGGHVPAGIPRWRRAEHGCVPACVESPCIAGPVHVVRAPAPATDATKRASLASTVTTPASARIPSTPASSVSSRWIHDARRRYTRDRTRCSASSGAIAIPSCPSCQKRQASYCPGCISVPSTAQKTSPSSRNSSTIG
jgi:hypothetical protein